MAKAPKKNKKKKDKEARIVLYALFFMFAVMLVTTVRLYGRQAEYRLQEQELLREIASEEARSEEIDAYEEYVGTDAYIEQIARERLGLAYPNELLLRPEE